MTMRILIASTLGTGCLLFAAGPPAADAPKEKVQISKTERVPFPPGGTLRFKHSVGVLTVTAWDRPDVEITTIKSTQAELDTRDREKGMRQLDKVKVTTERHGDELVIATVFPAHRPFGLPYPLSGQTNFDLEYEVKVPAKARIIADHTLGQVNIDSLVGDIQVTLAQGEILLHLPEEQKYAIHAKSGFGAVSSDFPTTVKHTALLVGQRTLDENSSARHKLNLRVGFGDIVIVKTRMPKPPEPLTPVQKTDGL